MLAPEKPNEVRQRTEEAVFSLIDLFIYIHISNTTVKLEKNPTNS